MWSELKEALNARNNFVLTTHVSPDGDGLGAELVLREYLRSLGKNVQIINADPIPERYEFLDADGVFLARGPEADELIEAAEVTVFVDTASWSQLGKLEERLKGRRNFRIAIDHHTKGDLETELAIREAGASATCEMLYEFAREVGFPITESLAAALFLGIATDTGWFRYGNTTAKVFEIASELCRLGAACGKLYQLVYERDPLARLHLMGRAMMNLKTDADGQIVYFHVDQAMFKECGVDDSYTEGFIRMARFVRGGKIMILFKEIEAGAVRVSFRSRGEIDVWALARELGGGGHRNAAGATVYGELQEVMERVLGMARGALSERPG